MANNNSSKSNRNNSNSTGNAIGIILIAAGFWYVSNNPGVLQKPALVSSSVVTKAYAASHAQTSSSTSEPVLKNIKENLSKLGSHSDSSKSNHRSSGNISTAGQQYVSAEELASLSAQQQYSSVYGDKSTTEPSAAKGGVL